MGFVGGVDVESVRDAGGGYFDRFSVFGCESAIFEGCIVIVNFFVGESVFGFSGGRVVGFGRGGGMVGKGGGGTMMALKLTGASIYRE